MVCRGSKKSVFLTYVIEDINAVEISKKLYQTDLQKTNQTKVRVGKEIKRKNDKLRIKWKSYDNSFNSWIYKIDLDIQNRY